jgi:hypothetical protein
MEEGYFTNQGPFTEEQQLLYKTELRERLGKKEFDGLLVLEVKKLMKKLPIPRVHGDTFQEMMQDFRVYALEAIDDFDMNNRTKFSSYLMVHLKIRSIQWFNWAWMGKNRPKGGSITLFSTLENGDSFDPIYYRENVALDLELCELLSFLSKSSRMILIHLFGRIDEPLIKAFRGDFDRVCAKIARMTGYSRLEIGRFLLEIRKLIPEHIEHIGATG